MAVKLTDEEKRMFASNRRLVEYFQRNLNATNRQMHMARDDIMLRLLQGQAQFLQDFVDQLTAPSKSDRAQGESNG